MQEENHQFGMPRVAPPIKAPVQKRVGGACNDMHRWRNRIPVLIYSSLTEARMIHLEAAADEARCVNRRRVASRSEVMRERAHPVPQTTDR
jgi:hypothetical protein